MRNWPENYLHPSAHPSSVQGFQPGLISTKPPQPRLGLVSTTSDWQLLSWNICSYCPVHRMKTLNISEGPGSSTLLVTHCLRSVQTTHTSAFKDSVSFSSWMMCISATFYIQACSCRGRLFFNGIMFKMSAVGLKLLTWHILVTRFYSHVHFCTDLNSCTALHP